MKIDATELTYLRGFGDPNQNTTAIAIVQAIFKDSKIKVTRKDGTQRTVMIMEDLEEEEKTGNYCCRFVNITPGHRHICTCKFKSTMDAVIDLLVMNDNVERVEIL